MITLSHTTVGRTPLDEWSAGRRALYLTTHNTRDRYPYPRLNSNPQSQQASGPRPTPWTARPLGSAGSWLAGKKNSQSCLESAGSLRCSASRPTVWPHVYMPRHVTTILHHSITYTLIKKSSHMYMRTWSGLSHVHILATLNPCPVIFARVFFPPEIINFIQRFQTTAMFSWIQAQRTNVVNNIQLRSNVYLSLSPAEISHLPTRHSFLLLSQKGKIAVVSTFLHTNGLTIWSPAVPYRRQLLKL